MHRFDAKLIFFSMTIANAKPVFQNCQGEGGKAKVACQRFDGAGPYVVLHFASREQRLAV